MPLPAQVDALDKVPEAFRGEYVEKDGKFVLQVENVLDVFAPGLVKKNGELLTEKKKAEQKALELEQRYAGIDLEEFERIKAEQAAAEEEKARKDGNHQSLLEQKDKLHNAEKTKLTTQLTDITKERDGLTKEIETLLVTNETLKAIDELDGVPDMLLPAIMLAGKVKVIIENGKRVVRIMDFSSDPEGVVLVGDSKGTPMSVKQYVETEFKNNQIWGGAFKSSGAGGSGASNSTHRQKMGIDLSKLPPAERMKALRRIEG